MKKLNNVECDIEFSIVWTTKNRYKVLNREGAEKCRKLIRQSCNKSNVNIIKGSIGKDYVYLMVSCPPNLSVSKLVQQLKRKTARVLQSKNIKHLWTCGYFCQSVGFVTKKIIKEYMENQNEENFKIIG